MVPRQLNGPSEFHGINIDSDPELENQINDRLRMALKGHGLPTSLKINLMPGSANLHLTFQGG